VQLASRVMRKRDMFLEPDVARSSGKNTIHQ
jgi:hypothetical protein